jgi:ParB family chromosome partitioning protein
MVESIKANGVLVPILTRKKAAEVEAEETDTENELFETLAGHNRINAAKIAGLETIPAIVLENISDDEAMVYVVETNLMQRSFSDMTHTEKAAVIAMHHNKMFSQGKRNDILEQLKALENPEAVSAAVSTEPSAKEMEADAGQRTDEKIGVMYSLSRNTIARYLRIDKLNAPLKFMLDKGKFTFVVAVELSFLDEQEQEILAECLEKGFSVNNTKAATLRNHSKVGMLDYDTIASILTGQSTAAAETKPRRVNIRADVYDKYFTSGQSPEEVEGEIEKALQLYFSEKAGSSK